jgi:hypothetical protein
LREFTSSTPPAGFNKLQVNLILNATYFKSDLETLACRVSRSSVLPFPCPDFACPTDQILHGYPWVELPDFRGNTRSWNGFEPVEMSQYPPPGTILRFGTTREVNVTATDAANRTVSCTTTVTVPPVVPCGTVEMNVTAGSYNRTGEFQANRTIIAGTLYKMKGILQSRLTGKGSVKARLQKGSDKYTGSIEFKGNRTKGTLYNLMISTPFTYQTASEALQVHLTVTNNTNRDDTIARYDVYCELLYAV